MKCTLFRSRPFYLHCVLIDVSTVCYAMTWLASWCVPPAAGSTFIALGITRLSNANNSRVSDDIKQVFIPSVVDVAEGIDDVSKGQEQ